MVKYTAKILQQMLQGFWNKSDHFGNENFWKFWKFLGLYIRGTQITIWWVTDSFDI